MVPILLQRLNILVIWRVDMLELFPRGMADFIQDPGSPPSPYLLKLAPSLQSLEHEEARAINRLDPAADGLSASNSACSGISAQSTFCPSQFSLLANFQVTFLVAMLVCHFLLPVWPPSACHLFYHRCMVLHSKFYWRRLSSTKDLFFSA